MYYFFILVDTMFHPFFNTRTTTTTEEKMKIAQILFSVGTFTLTGAAAPNNAAPNNAAVPRDSPVRPPTTSCSCKVLNAKLDSIQNEVDKIPSIENKVATIENKAESIENKVDTIENRVGNLESKVEGMDTKIDKILNLLKPEPPTSDPIVSAGGEHACVIDSLRDLWCWGWNSKGQLGIGDNDYRFSPTKVALQNDPLEIALGYYHTCIVNVLSKLYCFGWNKSGQLGVGDNVDYNTPREVALVNEEVAHLFVGYDHTCIIDVLSMLFCWGSNTYGELGFGDNVNRNTPTAVTLVNNPTQVALGKSHMCVVDLLSKLFCVGYNAFGQLGTGDTTNRFFPTEVTGLGNVDQVRAGQEHTCIVDSFSKLFCWGSNAVGQIGVGDAGTGLPIRPTPTQVSLQSGVSHLSLGYFHTCIIDVSSSLYCWGGNNFGEVGTGYYTPNGGIFIPTQIGFANGPAQISLDGYFSCALDDNGSLYCWGSNSSGQLGLGNANQEYFAPTFVRSF